MRYWKAGIFFLIAFFTQNSLLNMVNIGGYTPNLLLCLVVIFSFLYEKDMYDFYSRASREARPLQLVV